MKRIIIATLLALGCGDAPIETSPGDIPPMHAHGYSLEGEPRVCTPIEPSEQHYMSYEGYDREGCTRTERMGEVRPFADEEDQAVVEFGTARQPITVFNGSFAATGITVNSQQKITGFLGPCNVDPNWTIQQPERGNCLVPRAVSTLGWAVCPDCYSTTDRNYVRARMQEAWAVWSSTTASRTSTCNGVTFNSQLKLSSVSERVGGCGTPQQCYDEAPILVYPLSGNFNSARMSVDKDFVLPFTPVRQGIRYHGWQYAALEIDHQIIESVKLPVCVQANDPNRALKLQRGYQWILAHELGHAFGMPHSTSGIMRASANTVCTEMFSSATNSPALSAPSSSERLVVNGLKQSNGFDLVVPAAGTTCGSSVASSTSVDDAAVVNF